MNDMPPKVVYILLRTDFAALYALGLYITFLLLLFHWSLQTNRRFMLNMYSDVRDGLTGPNWSRTSSSYRAVSNYAHTGGKAADVSKPINTGLP
jgi:hypothetical protein